LKKGGFWGVLRQFYANGSGLCAGQRLEASVVRQATDSMHDRR
jgi:hypothetical protein